MKQSSNSTQSTESNPIQQISQEARTIPMNKQNPVHTHITNHHHRQNPNSEIPLKPNNTHQIHQIKTHKSKKEIKNNQSLEKQVSDLMNWWVH